MELTVIKNSNNKRVYLIVDENDKVIDFSSSVAVLKKKHGKNNEISVDLNREIAN